MKDTAGDGLFPLRILGISVPCAGVLCVDRRVLSHGMGALMDIGDLILAAIALTLLVGIPAAVGAAVAVLLC